ncbi:MAG: hypothetical protein M1282_04290 [Chloroflexi bacterium]|nr:hypothetical protein [Chloroflexota bacterium]
MTLFKLGLRVWIALTSIVSFLVGWIALAHSPKPVQPTSVSVSSAPGVSITPLPTLAPLSPLNFSNNGGNLQSQSFSVQPAPQPQVQPQNFFAPQPSFRTRGS